MKKWFISALTNQFFVPAITIITIAICGIVLTGCDDSANRQDSRAVERQQSQYSKAQPIPAYDHSLERQLVIDLYNIRNETLQTHSVWRGMTSVIEGDCPSLGYGIPYDTSLTNPLSRSTGSNGAIALGQAEPNGVFASTNTSATWVFCIAASGNAEPHYVEAAVTVYPGPVEVDYSANMATRIGDATVFIKAGLKASAPVVGKSE